MRQLVWALRWQCQEDRCNTLQHCARLHRDVQSTQYKVCQRNVGSRESVLHDTLVVGCLEVTNGLGSALAAEVAAFLGYYYRLYHTCFSRRLVCVGGACYLEKLLPDTLILGMWCW